MLRPLRPWVAVLALLLTACGGTAAPASPAPSSAPASPAAATTPAAKEKVSFRFDWTAGGQHVGFVVAKAKGYYDAAGLDVTLNEGKGSGVTMDTVASGADTLGDADSTTVALGISKGVPIKEVAGILELSPNCVFFHAGHPVKQPSDLKGRVLIVAANDAFSHILPAVLTKGGLTESQITLQVVQPSAKYQAFMKDPSIIMSGFSTNDFPNLQKLDPSVQYTNVSDWGLNTLAAGVIARADLLSQKPDLVKRFLAASAKGWADTIANPAEAVADTVKMFPNVDPKSLAVALDLTTKSLHTPASQGKPWGWMAQSDWQQTIDLAQKYGGLTNPKPVSDYFTNEYLPQS